MVNDYKAGNQLRIIGGIYKRKKYATFLHFRGSKMATISIQERNKQPYECNVHLSSIAKIPQKQTQPTAKKSSNIVLTREEYESLLSEVADLTKRLSNLEIALQNIGSRN